MSTNNIRTGVIGYGLSGRVFHAPFIDVVEGYELSKISFLSEKKKNDLVNIILLYNYIKVKSIKDEKRII